MSQTRQLAAIMFADIAGYTALMQADEALAIQYKDKMKHKLESLIHLHNGKLIKLSGDGALCSFGSASEAVRAAIALQQDMQADPRVPVRIGIHEADVIFEDGDVHGDGVNIASRLESLAVPGSIFISAKVVDDTKNQNDIQTVSLGKYLLKNVKEPVEIYAVSNPGLVVPRNRKLEGKGLKYVSNRISIGKKALLIRILALLIILAAATLIFIPPIFKKQRARNKTIPAIQKLVAENFLPPTQAFDLALDAEKYIPNDSALAKLMPLVSTIVSIETSPAGAEVYWKDYTKPADPWRSAGITPLKEIKCPRGYLRMEIRKPGYQTIEYAGPMAYARLGSEIDTLLLDKEGSLPTGMVRIPPGAPRMYIVGMEHLAGPLVPEFLMDKYEVTNAAYKKFIDEGGYSNREFWKHPIHSNGKTIPFEEVAKLFVDKTGRPGPANWEAGVYPDQQANHPVTGISWYEAAAYAAWAGKHLPTIFHWAQVAETSRTEFIIPLSNYNGKSTTPVGSMAGFSKFGVYDLAGNAREWCYNESNTPELRFILGGGWNDPTYSFNDAYIQSQMDRSSANGFRCMKELPGKNGTDLLMKPAALAFRDYRKEKPVDDKTFEFIRRQYNYDNTALNATIDSSFETEIYKGYRVSFDAAYNKERMIAMLFLPKNFQPPFQPIVFFPGSGDIFSKKFHFNGLPRIDFILKSGRALIIPIYKGTHERHDELKSDLQEETVFYKDHVIMWRKDFGRTLDYLETRNDIQKDKVGYLGFSWGGFLGGIIPAVEKRIKAVVLNVGGMEMHRALPEADQINFLPRVKQPVLMVNGKHDMFFPIETSQKPMFDLLGTQKEDKKLFIYESGHLVPRVDLVRETLAWFDKYLGPVTK